MLWSVLFAKPDFHKAFIDWEIEVIQADRQVGIE
jgi:hypothetical protein